MRAAGKCRRIAPIAGVVKTTSPINRSRTRRMFGTSGTSGTPGTFGTLGTLLFDRGFVDQHHRDVVLDRIDAVTRFALERLSVLHQRDRRLACRAGEYFEQF